MAVTTRRAFSQRSRRLGVSSVLPIPGLSANLVVIGMGDDPQSHLGGPTPPERRLSAGLVSRIQERTANDVVPTGSRKVHDEVVGIKDPAGQ